MKGNHVRDHLPYRFYLSLFATVLAFIVVVLGAYTRLTDAGLGCPDWPGCYGKWIVSASTNAIDQPISLTKAWTEMIHRYLAGALGFVILVQAFLAVRHKHSLKQPFLLSLLLVALVAFQALLGMWTVTFKLFPLVVMAHLLGGFTIFSLLGWLTLTLSHSHTQKINIQTIKMLRLWAMIGLLVLIAQLFLGGWTSANYAALVCLDFPFCNLNQFYEPNFSTAFNLTSAGIGGSIGEPLDSAARMTIHMLHRVGALLTTLMIGSLVFLIFFNTRKVNSNNNFSIYKLNILIAILLILQVLLGIANVLARLPLTIAVLHNAVAALLLMALVVLNYYLYLKPKEDPKQI